jgi:hypothetical protein
LIGLRRRLGRLSGAALREAVLDLHFAGIRAGDLIYDSYLDVARQATIDRFDDKLAGIVGHAAHICDDFEQLILAEKVCTLIVSHHVYIDYGIPLRLSLKHGRPVYGRVWLDPISVRRYERLDEGAEFTGMPVRPALDYFRRKLGPRLLERAKEFFPPGHNKKFGLDYFRYGYGADKTEYSKRELVELLGIDPAKKTCLIMAQQFTDAPHCYPDMLFEDYYEWLDQTLTFAAAHDGVNWLLRQHPYEILIGETEFFETLVRRHLGPTSRIKLVPNTVTTSSLFSCVDAVTTAIGSGGIEFASAGTPCILAGNPFYGDFDFAVRPPTRDAYFAALSNIPSLNRLTDDQVMAARELALVFLSYKRLSSTRVPHNSDLAGRSLTQDDFDRFWLDAASLVDTVPLEDDPLYRNLRTMIESNHSTLFDFEIT